MQTHLERFIRFLAAEKGLSTAYQLSVRQTLEEFARFLEMENTGLAQTGIDTLSAFLRHLQDRGMARSSMRVEMVHLRIFFRWLAGTGILEKDPSVFLEMPRQGLSLPHVLDQKTVSSLLESIDIQDIPLGCRDRALLEMIYACGMRVSEIINCKLESFDRDEAFVRVLGKGDKTRLVPVGRSALNALQMYLEKGRPKLVRTVTKSHIFLTMRGRPLTRSGFAKFSGNVPEPQDWNSMFSRISCAIPSPRIFWKTERICALFRRCWVMPIFQPPRSIRIWSSSG